LADEDAGKWLHRAEYEFWAYGVIDRGWISPGLFHQVGVQPLQLKVPLYFGDDENGLKFLEGKANLVQMRDTYDYIWAYNVRVSNPELNMFGKPIVTVGRIQVLRTDQLRLN
jgi:hypothetical protein